MIIIEYAGTENLKDKITQELTQGVKEILNSYNKFQRVKMAMKLVKEKCKEDPANCEYYKKLVLDMLAKEGIVVHQTATKPIQKQTKGMDATTLAIALGAGIALAYFLTKE